MTSPTPPTILVVDDDAPMRDLICEQLHMNGYGAHTAANAKQARKILAQSLPDAVLTDVRMPGESGLELCRALSKEHPNLPIIVMTAFGDMECAIEAIRAGASDFLPKPFNFDVLEFSLRKALHIVSLQKTVDRLQEQHSTAEPLPRCVSQSAQRIRDLTARVAPLHIPVVICGESGVGKELVARSIHEHSTRSSKPYVVVNCAALPSELLESELFGHVKGAFTGANQARQGLFRRAHEGTLFLDEIGDMPPLLQVKLLRVLETGSFCPVGSDQEIHTDVRIVSATHRPLQDMTQTGEFRLDLFYRLNGITLDIPPLRERPEDITSLARVFLQEAIEQFSLDQNLRFSQRALDQLARHPWPGNVRELKHAVHTASIMSTGHEISLDHIPQTAHPSPSPATSYSPEMSLEAVIHAHIAHVLQSVHGNKSQAARILGIDRKTLYAKLEKLGLA